MLKTWTSPRPRRVSLHLWVYRYRLPILAVAAAVAVGALATVAYFTSIVVARFEGRRWNLPSRIYSDLLSVRAGDGRSADKLVAKLDRLLYQEDEEEPSRPGHYRRSGNTVELFTRGFRYPGHDFPGFRATVEFSGGRVVSVRGAGGDSIPSVVIEPELLGSVFGDEVEDRSLVRLAELPKTLTDAILVTEDRDFYRHAGVSIRRTFGAVFSNLKGAATQGGSTLTQQLVKNLYLSPERTLRRKGIEAILSMILDARYSKDEIFQAYVNEIYLGREGSIAITGVGEAARHYFGKEASDLDLAESATIAGMIKAPNVYSPLRNPAKTIARRDLVLRMMHDEKKIDDRQFREAVAEPLQPVSPQRVPDEGAAFRGLRQGRARGAVRREAEDRGPSDLYDPRRRSAAGGPAGRDRGPRRPREEIPAAGGSGQRGAAPGRADHARARDGSGPRVRRRARLSPLAVQSGHAGASSARLPLQAVRLPGRLLAAGPAPSGHARHDLRRCADHGGVGPKGSRTAVDAPQLRQQFPRKNVRACGARAVDQHPDGSGRARSRPSDGARDRARRGDRFAAPSVSLDRARGV